MKCQEWNFGEKSSICIEKLGNMTHEIWVDFLYILSLIWVYLLHVRVHLICIIWAWVSFCINISYNKRLLNHCFTKFVFQMLSLSCDLANIASKLKLHQYWNIKHLFRKLSIQCCNYCRTAIVFFLYKFHFTYPKYVSCTNKNVVAAVIVNCEILTHWEATDIDR